MIPLVACRFAPLDVASSLSRDKIGLTLGQRSKSKLDDIVVVVDTHAVAVADDGIAAEVEVEVAMEVEGSAIAADAAVVKGGAGVALIGGALIDVGTPEIAAVHSLPAAALQILEESYHC